MKLSLLVLAMVALAVTNAWGTTLNTTRSNTFREFPRTTLVTASIDISGAVSQVVYKTPATSDFILTGVCTGSASGGILLQAGDLKVAQVGSGSCVAFTPGMVLPPDQLVSCTTFAEDADTFCTITGILGAPAPTPRPTTPTPGP